MGNAVGRGGPSASSSFHQQSPPASPAAMVIPPMTTPSLGGRSNNNNLAHLSAQAVGIATIPAAGDGPNSGVKRAAGGSPAKKKRIVREKNRFGSVIVKVASVSSNRRVQERQNVFTITPRGGLFHGTQCNPILVQNGNGMKK